MSMKELFPTLFYQGKINSAKLKSAIAEEIVILKDIDDVGAKWSKKNYPNGYTSYGSMTQLHKTSPNFADFEKALLPHVKQFIKAAHWDLAGEKLQMTTCWVNWMGYGAHHTMHTHPHSVLSGVWYVSLPDKSSVFKIEDPRFGFMMAAPTRSAKCPENMKPFVELKPKEGEFYLFESWLRHEVPVNLSKRPRLSVSFNFE